MKSNPEAIQNQESSDSAAALRLRSTSVDKSANRKKNAKKKDKRVKVQQSASGQR